MKYDSVLKQIKPDKYEKEKVTKLAGKIIAVLNHLAEKNDIPAEATLVGSVAKGTWLSGKADVDIFLKFPLETSMRELKEKGLYLGYECIKKIGGYGEERFASHPYVTGKLEGYEIDFVPCYSIKSSKQLKSAVDRTILHNIYIQQNLKKDQIDEVLLLKKFMDSVECYGSEFKVGGFAGYLCELLILKYDDFEGVLNAAAQEWKPGLIIDLENLKTGEKFSEPLVCVDPVDENRNVAAALTLKKMAEFVIASRNFSNKPQEDYFSTRNIYTNPESILKQFKQRKTKTILITFKAPDIPPDALYAQLEKTKIALTKKLVDEGFMVEKSSYWTNENDLAIFILEFVLWSLPAYQKHWGPKIWNQVHQNKFLEKYGEDAYLDQDRWVVELPWKYEDAYSFLKFILAEENIHHLKTGKQIKNELRRTYKINDIDEVISDMELGVLNFLFKFLNPNWHLWR